MLTNASQLDALPIGAKTEGCDWIADELPCKYVRKDSGWVLDFKFLEKNIDPMSSKELWKRWTIWSVVE